MIYDDIGFDTDRLSDIDFEKIVIKLIAIFNLDIEINTDYIKYINEIMGVDINIQRIDNDSIITYKFKDKINTQSKSIHAFNNIRRSIKIKDCDYEPYIPKVVYKLYNNPVTIQYNTYDYIDKNLLNNTNFKLWLDKYLLALITNY